MLGRRADALAQQRAAAALQGLERALEAGTR